MKIATLSLLAALSAGFAGSALAGVNEGGYLLLHTDDSVIYSSDDEGTYCDILSTECPFDPECDDTALCADFLKSDINPTSGLNTDTSMIWVIAAFPETSCPSVLGVQFGFDWDLDANVQFIAFGNCGDFEIATDGWPDDLNSGTAVTWSNAVNRTGFPVYWLAAYTYYLENDVISVGNFATGPAQFADDSTPAVLDDVPSQNWGSMGLRGGVGENPYLGPTPTLDSSWGEVKAIFGR